MTTILLLSSDDQRASTMRLACADPIMIAAPRQDLWRSLSTVEVCVKDPEPPDERDGDGPTRAARQRSAMLKRLNRRK